jgi:20S proteasome alpha/beta subunit
LYRTDQSIDFPEDIGQDSYTDFRLSNERLGELTCVIGASCDDGCVIISDRRVLRGYDATEESKVQILWDKAAMAGAGTAALLDKLATSLKKSKIPTTPDFEKTVETIENIVFRLRRRYHPRLGSNFGLQAIIMGLKEFNKGDPYIRLIDPLGITEDIKAFNIIGRGAKSVAPLFAMLYDHGLTLAELAALGYFSMSAIIKLGIDQSIGASVGPDIVILKRDEEPRFLSPSDNQFSLVRDSLEDLKFKYVLLPKVWSKIPKTYENVDRQLLNHGTSL